MSLFLALFGLLAGALVVQGALAVARRLALDPDNPYVMDLDHEVYGWFHVPNREFSYRSRYTHFRTRIRINDRGLRGPTCAYEKPADVYRILVLGNSFTASFEVPEEQVWHRRVERSLNARPPMRHSRIRRVEIIGAGVQGWATDQELLYCRHEGHKYNADLVLLQFFADDLLQNDVSLHQLLDARFKPMKPYFVLRNDGLELRNFPFRQPEPVRTTGSEPRTSFYLKRARVLARGQQATLRVAKSLTRALRDQLRPHCYKATGVPGELLVYAPDYPSEWEAAWRLTSRLIRELAAEVEQSGQRFAVVYFPHPRQVMPLAWEHTVQCWSAVGNRMWDLDRPNHLLKDLLASERVPYLDVTDAFRRKMATTDLALYFPMEWHLNPAGHEVAADLLRTWLVGGSLTKFDRDSGDGRAAATVSAPVLEGLGRG